MVMNTGCSSKRPGFEFLDPHSASQSSVSPVLEDSILSSSLHMHQAYAWYSDIHSGNTHKSNIIFLRKMILRYISLIGMLLKP